MDLPQKDKIQSKNEQKNRNKHLTQDKLISFKNSSQVSFPQIVLIVRMEK